MSPVDEPVAAREAPLGLKPPWWCAPHGIALGFLLPIFCIVSYAVDLNLPGLTARGLHFLTMPYLALGAFLVLVMAYGGWLGTRIDGTSKHPPTSRSADIGALIIGLLGLMAYVIWFQGYLLNPGNLWALIVGGASPDRTPEDLVAGVTSFSNGAPVFFTIWAWRRVFRPNDPLAWWMTPLGVVLVLFTAFRVYAWSERVAMIEATLPIALIYACKFNRSSNRVARLAIKLGPFLALPLVMAFFGLAEFFRSWSSEMYHGKIDFVDFVVGRMAAYYYTSLNNGAGFLTTQDWPTFRFEYVLNFAYTFPLSIGPLFMAMVGATPASPAFSFGIFLATYGDVEFNNPSGFYTVIYDLGIPLGIVYFMVTGFLTGMMFKRLASGSLTGALFYPIFFISYLEVFRYPYLGSGRAFAWAVCVLIVLVTVHSSRFARKDDGWTGAKTRFT